MSVKTPKKHDLEAQVSTLLERFEAYTSQDSARWQKVQSLLDALEQQAPVPPARVEVDEDGLWRFLKSNDLFGRLPDHELSEFIGFGQFKTLNPGDWLFHAGDDCDAVIAIRHGLLEICREDEGEASCAALLGVGEVLGMLGALTGGRHRSSARFPEGGEVLIIDAANFDRAIEALPRLSAGLTRSLARRLIGAVQRGDMSRAKKRQLEGSLAHFDLSTVLQSLFSTDSCAGIVKISAANGDLLGEIDVADGHVVSCTAGELVDNMAFQHLFIADNSQNRFSFQESDVLADDSRPTGEIAKISGAGLLMDCARIADEMRRIKSGVLGDKEYILARREKPTRWQDTHTKELARQIWLFLDKQRSVQEILDQEFGCDHDVMNVLHTFHQNGNLK